MMQMSDRYNECFWKLSWLRIPTNDKRAATMQRQHQCNKAKSSTYQDQN